jgi:hypothetical protein
MMGRLNGKKKKKKSEARSDQAVYIRPIAQTSAPDSSPKQQKTWEEYLVSLSFVSRRKSWSHPRFLNDSE